jgi:hypothetical protein
MISELTYDVGIHDRSDTALCLFRGFRVVAIEANPVLVERATVRFAPAEKAGRLTILGVGMDPRLGCSISG